MSTHKNIDAICVLIMCIVLCVTIILMTKGNELIESTNGDDLFTAEDLNGEWQTSGATTIDLSSGSATISYGGKYIVTGSNEDATLTIDTNKNSKVWILLDGINLNSSKGPAINVQQAKKVYLTLKEDTQNVITCENSSYSEKADGAIFSKDDLTINGEGQLKISTEYKHGVVCNDVLSITGGKITIDAVRDGLHANDEIRIKKAEINIKKSVEGIEAPKIYVAGGKINVTSTDDGFNACGDGEDSLIEIRDGKVEVLIPDGRDSDGLDSNGSINITGGEIFISVRGDGSSSAIDYGTENNGTCTISGGTVVACGGSGMAEGFEKDSEQGFIMYNVQGQEGTKVTLKSDDGNTLITKTIPSSFANVVISTPKMKVGDKVYLTVGNATNTITVDNSTTTSQMGGMNQGSEPPSGGGGPQEPQGQMEEPPAKPE